MSLYVLSGKTVHNIQLPVFVRRTQITIPQRCCDCCCCRRRRRCRRCSRADTVKILCLYICTQVSMHPVTPFVYLRNVHQTFTIYTKCNEYIQKSVPYNLKYESLALAIRAPLQLLPLAARHFLGVPNTTNIKKQPQRAYLLAKLLLHTFITYLV